MAKNLLIVESPAKAGTIAKYLGSDYEVIASMGHVRDLPASKLGVDVENNFEPHYIIPLKARKTLKALKEAVKGKETIYLATDLDREGEAIAWHISQALDLQKSDAVQVYRITFDEITKPALLEAIKKPRSLNQELIDAQQARRVLDRLVGYTLSPVLWKKIYKGLSAGRVQSVALRLIIDRERERQAFVTEEYWSLKALLKDIPTKSEITAQLVNYAGKKIEQQTLKTNEEVQSIVESLKKAVYQINKIEKKPLTRRPYAPYTTSTFQQDGVNKLGLSSKRAMQIAQKLYEGGHITYMRTDSVALADSAVQSIRHYIEGEYGKTYIPSKPRFYESKAKNAQEAHEAIRPTNPQLKGEEVTGDAQGQKVYDLIRRRALASQMSDAALEQTSINIAAEQALFRATGQQVIFPGFLAVWGSDTKEEQLLPILKENAILDLKELKPEQHFTEPPPRFSEATLIKSLEEQGIGRPSTYAPTIDTLIQRNYVKLEQRRFTPEEVGYLVTDMLKQNFPDVVDLGFTAAMEEKLDSIASGNAQYQEVLQGFWEPFNKNVEESVNKIEKIDTTEQTDQICPTCGSPMIIKMGRFGKFLACTKFPECKTTQPIQTLDPNPLVCPRCGKPLAQKRARRGVFFGCSGYPECNFAIWKKDQLVTKVEELEKEGETLPFKEQAIEALQAQVAVA